MTLIPGIHYDVPFMHYLSDPGINQSELKKFGRARSPWHYKHNKDHGEEEDKAHLRIGTYVDNYLFRNESKTGKLTKAMMEEIEIAAACVNSIERHSDATRIINACRKQVVVIADNPRRKGLIDLLPDPDICDPLLLDYVPDLKTAADASVPGFRDACHKFGYNVQAAYYMDLLETVGRKVTTFIFIVVETKPPYAVAIHYMPRDSGEIETGRRLYQRWLKDYSACLEKNEWPGYGDSWTRVQFKPWQFREADEPERIS